MAEITLKGKSDEVKVLKVNIGKKTYSVPLSGSLSIKEMRSLAKGEIDGFEFFAKYIPAEVLEELTSDDFAALTEEWKKASAGKTDSELGE